MNKKESWIILISFEDFEESHQSPEEFFENCPKNDNIDFLGIYTLPNRIWAPINKFSKTGESILHTTKTKEEYEKYLLDTYVYSDRF